jgi:hypothetical protein
VNRGIRGVCLEVCAEVQSNRGWTDGYTGVWAHGVEVDVEWTMYCKGHYTVNTNANAKEQVALGRGRASLEGVVSGERTGIWWELESGEA